MIPVLDYEEFRHGDRAGFVKAFGKACRDTGFLVLTGHGIASTQVNGLFDQARAFFAMPQDAKDRLSINQSPHNRGYARAGDESLDEKSGVFDVKEAYNIGLDFAPDDPRILAGEPYRGVNLWPDLPAFRDTLLSYFDAVLALGVDLHRAIALDLGLPETWFAPHFEVPIATLRLLRYPAAAAAPGSIGAGAHSDYGSVTLLMTDGVPGLQVKPRGGDWMDVPQVPGGFVMNIGDMLMRWTNDTYVSTPHRVVRPPQERYSAAFFLEPKPDTVVSALPGFETEAKYPPITSATYLTQRLKATYAQK